MAISGSPANGFNSSQRHAEIPADRGFVDAVTRAQRADLARKIMLARQSAQPVVQPIERDLFRRRGVGIEAGGRAADLDFDRHGALAITASSAIHHSRPVPSAKSLVT